MGDPVVEAGAGQPVAAGSPIQLRPRFARGCDGRGRGWPPTQILPSVAVVTLRCAFVRPILAGVRSSR